jgi:hypothetical protein
MIWARQFAVFALAAVLLSGIGCAKRKPQLPVEANAPAETVPSSLPPEISEETPPPEAPALPTELPKIEEPKPQPVKRHKKKPATTPPATQSSSTTPAPSSNSTTVAAAHPTPPPEAPADTAIAADVPSKELSQQKQTTAQLLESTEKTLDGLPRSLSHDEEEMVTQIRSYVAQSHKATTDGDFERAYNLATKAHLLSDALVKK